MQDEEYVDVNLFEIFVSVMFINDFVKKFFTVYMILMI